MEEPIAPRIRRHFLSWEGPLLPQAVEWLAKGWDGKGPLDLSATLVLVPTRQAGRRLREALALQAATCDQAVFPPRVQLPETLLETSLEGEGRLATRVEAQLAWAEVLRAVPLDAFRAVFPVDPPARTATWALELAAELLRLQRRLAEGGLCMSAVPDRVGPDFPERERWRQLGRLEQLQTEALESRGLLDPQRAWLEGARDPACPAGIERIVLLGAPDPLPLVLGVLTRLATVVPVDVVVFADKKEADVFDLWGRPDAGVWGQRRLDLPSFRNRVHLCADPAAQAERMAAAIATYRDIETVVAIGSADHEVWAPLDAELGRGGVIVFNPEGRRRAGDGLHQLLSALERLALEDSFSAATTLARCPDFLQHLTAQHGADFSAAKFLSGLDELHDRHLPATLAEARRHRPGDVGLKAIAEIREALRAGSFVQAATSVPATLYSTRRFDLAERPDASVAEAAAAWMEIIRSCERASERFGGVGMKPAEWWTLALGLYGETRCYDEKPAGALELQGWLELLWEDAPHLIVAGLNDGRVPEAVVGDPFLPESLRVSLGLTTNGQRFARDAYILHALSHCRQRRGRLDLLFGRASAAGDPLRPSRLLLRCPDDELPGRIGWLFRPAEASRPPPSWRRAWKLAPRHVPPPKKVAVTALRSWLACPFRFHLRHGLEMEAVAPAKMELDARDFGTLCHAALEAMGREAGLRECMDEAVIRDFLLTVLERETVRRFGAAHSLPLVIQVESARQRLSRAAIVQAEARREGWVIERVEEKFLLKVGELMVSGKIDRVERNEFTGSYRVIDYKTSDRPVDPKTAHLRPLRRGEQVPDFAFVDPMGEGPVWCDLQLPLYRRAVGVAAAPVECAYFNLPKAAGETGIRPWVDYTRDLDASAWRCAEGVAAAIVAGNFWPPNEALRPEWDEFSSLFHHGVAGSVEWEEASP